MVFCPKLDCYIFTFLLTFVYLPFVWNKNANVLIFSISNSPKNVDNTFSDNGLLSELNFLSGYFFGEIVQGVTHIEVIQSEGFHHCIPSCPSSTSLQPSLSHCLLVLCAVVILLGNEEKRTGHTPPCSEVHPCVLLSCLLGRESSS